MSLEDLTGTGKFIDDLVNTNPVGASDPKSQGDDHIRGIKNVLLNTFPNLTGAMTSTQTELNYLAGVTPGTQAASKAVVADANVNTGVAKITELHIGASGSETQVTSTATELNLLDGETAIASANTASAIVKRDGSGNFSANTITAVADVVVGANLNLGGVDITYAESSPTPNGDFTGGTIDCAKIGKMVTISFYSLTHSSASSASSAAGLIPAAFRPSTSIANYYNTAVGGGVSRVNIAADGTFSVYYVDWAGSPTSAITSAGGSISYNV